MAKEAAIPKKAYFRIGEVAEICGLEPHVLRYWEREFPQIRPKRVAGQRLYRRKDVEIILQIKKLLYDEGFTIAGARKRLAEKPTNQSLLQEIKRELLELKELLERD